MGVVGSRQFAMLTLGMSLPLLFSFNYRHRQRFCRVCRTYSSEHGLWLVYLQSPFS
jgi:hypothetical protein